MPRIDAPKYLNLKTKHFREGVSPYKRDGLPLYKRLNEGALRALKKKAVNDIWAFCDLIDFYGGTESFEAIHHDLAQFLMSTQDNRLVLMPRGHFKSTFCSTLYVMWRIYNNPNIRIMVGSAGKELAIGFVRQIMQFFEDQELQEYVWNSRPHYDGPLIPDIDRTREKRRKKRQTEDPDAFSEYLDDPSDVVGKKVLWRANALQVIRPKTIKEPTVFACSVGMVMTGWHYDLAILDDLCTRTNSATPEKVDKIEGWVNDVTSVLDPRTRPNSEGLGEEMVFLGTRYFKWDLYGRMLGTHLDSEEEKEEYWDTVLDDPLHVIQRDIYGNGFGTIEDSLWRKEIPSWDEFTTPHYMCPRLMDERLERKKRRKSSWFHSQYLNKIYNPEKVLLDYEAIQFFEMAGIRKVSNQTIIKRGSDEVDAKGVHLRLVTVVDPAASVNKSADYMCITTGGLDKDNNLYILDTKYGHWMPSDFAKEIAAQLDRWKQSRVIIEANGLQQYIVNSLQEQFQLMGKTYYIQKEMPSGDKKQGILDAIEPYLNERRVWLPKWMEKLTEPSEEMKFFPAAGARDDWLDTVKMLIKHANTTQPVDESLMRRRKRARKEKVNSRYGGIR